MVREATLEDMPIIAALAKENHETVNLDMPPINAPKFIEWIKSAHKVYLGSKNEGIIALKIVPFNFSDGQYVTNILYYVTPSGRKSMVAVRLLNAAKKFAESIDMPLMIGVMTGHDAELKGEFFKRQGMKFIGGAYMTE